MSTTIQQMRDQYRAKHAELNSLIGGPDVKPEAIKQGKALKAELDQLGADIESKAAEVKELEDLKAGLRASDEFMNKAAGSLPFGGGQEKFKLTGVERSGESTVQRKDGRLRLLDEAGAGTFGRKTWEHISTVDYEAAFMNYVRNNGDRSAMDPGLVKVLTEGVDSQGGYFAPAELINRIIQREPAPTSLPGLVQKITTSRDSVEIPRLNYVDPNDRYNTPFRITSTGEIPSSDTVHAVDDTNLFGAVQIPVHTFMLSTAMSKNLLEDSAFNFQSWLEDKFGEARDLLKEDKTLNGNGVNEPLGILAGANSSNGNSDPVKPEVILSGVAGSFDEDSLYKVQAKLAPQYENPRTRWIMNKYSAYLKLMQLKDNNDRPLFTMGANDYGIVSGRGRQLLGDPLTLSQFMPDVGASNFPIIYGDPYGYYLVERVGLSFQLLDQTLAKRNQVELVGRLRFGGKVVEPWRFKIMKSNNS